MSRLAKLYILTNQVFRLGGNKKHVRLYCSKYRHIYMAKLTRLLWSVHHCRTSSNIHLV